MSVRLARTFEEGAATRAELGRHLNTRLPRLIDAAKRAAVAFARFAPTFHDAATQRDPTFVARGADVSAAQRAVMTADLEREPRVKRTGIRIVGKGAAEALAPDAGSSSREAPLADVLSLLGAGVVLAAPNPLAEREAEQRADEEVAALGGAPPGPVSEPGAGAQPATSSAPAPGGSASHLDGADVASAGVATQMNSMTAPEDPVTFGVPARATMEDANTGLALFELRPGPADVVAFHDFHNLQIAFRHVWTEVFDGALAKAGQTLYEEWVRLRDDAGLPVEDVEVTSVDEYRQFMDDLRRSSERVAGADDRYVRVRQLVPELTLETWARLDEPTREALYALAEENGIFGGIGTAIASGITAVLVASVGAPSAAEQARAIIAAATSDPRRVSRVEKLLADMEARLAERLSFDVFAPGSINFGILVGYRQRWTPINYQVGDLVSTVPLAPRETRKYVKRVVVKKSRSTKELENALRVRKEEAAETARADAEIVRSANQRSTFRQNAEGGVNFAVWNARGSQGLEAEASTQSRNAKKEFRENVLKAAEEYRQEHRLEIDATTTDESEETSTAEISNPNDEIPVTYLFYELQRTWDVCEQIHDIAPVILVAQDVPRPDQIDEEWLLANDWVLRRAILDDSFVPALDYLSRGFVGDEIAAEVQRSNLTTQLGLVARVGQQVKVGASALGKAQHTLSEAIDAYARTQVKGGGGFLGAVGKFLFGSGPDASEAMQVRLDAAKDAFDRAEREQATLRARLESELTALQVATDNYARTMEQQFNRRTEIVRLRAHVKENILYYMQAVWDHEPPDQRFFRLYKLDAPDIEVTPAHKATVRTSVPSLTEVASATGARAGPAVRAVIPRPLSRFTTRKLVEIADLDNLLGFKGNYAIFPMKTPNAITAFMMQDYVEIADDKVRARDPDELGQATTAQLLALARLDGVAAERVDGSRRQALRSALVERWKAPVAEHDMVVVPTRALYIDALPGRHPVLEDYKLVHRAVDVKKVQAEVRKAELENIRLAVRAVEGQLEDPDVEKKVVISGSGAVVVPSDA